MRASLKAKLKAIAKEHKLKLHFTDSIKLGGEYYVGRHLARIATDMREAVLISTFFHELGHHIDNLAGVYREFYKDSNPLWMMRKFGLRAERHADKTGQQLCKKYFPKLRYLKSYRNKEEIDFHREYYRDKRTKKKLDN